ncbi:MAG: hypothetical protein F4164_08355 [Gemmatimonadales bacterium]|nr:hypothetical protein [Gemmatimonadales bacterium]MYG49364.1 hypothetical protein [Gemmatimonadales bacterium]MYK03121.1 hypothetical protein [Candidatus Palauibacter ramosifaciens]
MNVEDVRQRLNGIQHTLEPSRLARREELGAELNFEEVIDPATRIVDLFRMVPLGAVDHLSSNQMARMGQRLVEIRDIVGEIDGFSATDANAVGRRDSLIQRMKAAYDDCLVDFGPIIPFLVLKISEPQNLEARVSEKLQELEERFTERFAGKSKESDELMQLLTKHSEEAEKKVDAISVAAGKVGVATQATFFEKARSHHEGKSTVWQGRTWRRFVGLLVVSVILLGSSTIPFFYELDMTTAESIQLALGKALLFGTVSYGLYLAAKNYLAHKHNEIVNMHRRNALQTFETLAEAAGTPQNRDVVLTYAAACIFGPQPTGYTRRDGDSASPPSSIIEIVKGMAATDNG